MFIEVLEKIGLGKVIDLSDDGLEHLKLSAIFFFGFIGFVVIFAIPWMYGFFKISFTIFKGVF